MLKIDVGMPEGLEFLLWLPAGYIGGWDWLGPLPFWHYRDSRVKHSLESISPDGNGVHKKHALNLPAKIGINKSVMASGFKERVPRGVHPNE